MIDYVYIKDLPEPLRAGRMAKLRTDVERAKVNGYERCVVLQRQDGSVEAIGTSAKDADDCGRNTFVFDFVREVYDLTADLEPQFSERRALHW